jgi:pimeloyl-ACP methyl ester carboxylesterase
LENSNHLTNKSNALKIPGWIKSTGKVLQFFSRDMATQYAARLFATPLKYKVPERELMMRNSAKNEKLFVPGIDAEVQVYVYGYSKVKVLMVHGWAGRGTQLYEIADKILENKMMVVSFDAPAHGLSSGKRTNMLDFIETIREIDKKYGPFDAAIGHSFGAMSLINAVAEGLTINKLVIIGADNSIPYIFKDFVKKLELKPVIATKLQKLFEHKKRVKADDYSSENKARKVNIPTFVVHDSEDKYVNVSSALAIRQNLEQGELLITNGLGHHKIFKNKFVIQRIINFIK